MAVNQEKKLKDNCKPEAGQLVPTIDRSKCEAKQDCVAVCPYNVFEIRELTKNEKQQLSLPSRLKLFVHGGQQAFAVRAEECHSCGLCVQACPEKAIKLINPARLANS